MLFKLNIFLQISAYNSQNSKFLMESSTCMLKITGVRCIVPEDARYYEICSNCLDGCSYDKEDDKACLDTVYKTFNYVRYCKNHYYEMKIKFQNKINAEVEHIKNNYVLCGFHMEKYDWKEELKVLHFISNEDLGEREIENLDKDEYNIEIWPMDIHYKYFTPLDY